MNTPSASSKPQVVAEQPPSTQSKGYSLHIGLNKADPRHYPGLPELKAAVADARFWQLYAQEQGYDAAELHDEQASAQAVKEKIAAYGKLLQPGDIFLLTYAGHGGAIPNDKPRGFDDERVDQTWCLYDRQLLDDELYECFEAFAEGVRILVVSDSCHSGTVIKAAELDFSLLLAQGMAGAARSRNFRSRMLPGNVQRQVLASSGTTVYQPLQEAYRTKKQTSGVRAAVKLLAACQDDEETLDGESNGIFTEAFINIFKEGRHNAATAQELIEEVGRRYFFPRPNFFEYGSIIESFDNAFPFRISIPDAVKVSGRREPDLTLRKKSRVVTGSDGPWDAMMQKKAAVLLVEVEGGMEINWTAGKGVNVKDRKQKGGRELIMLELEDVPHEHGWSAAHALQTELEKQDIKAIVEPVLTVTPAQQARMTREGDANNPDYIQEWPPSFEKEKVGIGWHLDNKHSQLTDALDFVVEKKPEAQVRIGHFDTGYIEGHVALPKNLRKEDARSFISGETPEQAIDSAGSGQDGHGLGTIALLAGNEVDKEHTFDEYKGYIGGVPFAEVIPMRLSDSVVIMNTENFCEAIEYAIEKRCEVISMSMAGKPSKRMARAVNDAYEAGIVLVSAASNCWYDGPGALLPKCVMFPAAFERVIAATGALYNDKPYDKDFLNVKRSRISTKYMQGCWGPASRMKKALAAYTPNTPWASSHHTFLRSGGGTSSATPQVAAAAALWIAFYRDELREKGYYENGQQWKKVEAVRYALYESAAKDSVFTDWKKYYGNGILRAYDALQIGVPDEDLLQKAPKAESSFWGIMELVGSFFSNRRLFRDGGVKPPPEALATELMHLLQTDPQFYPDFSELDLSDPVAVQAKVNDPEFRQRVMRSAYASDYLKAAMME